MLLNAAQRLATLCRARSTVAMRTDVEMFNKNVYSSLSRFYTLVSVFQSFFLVFLGDDGFLIFQAQLRFTTIEEEMVDGWIVSLYKGLKYT